MARPHSADILFPGGSHGSQVGGPGWRRHHRTDRRGSWPRRWWDGRRHSQPV